MLKPYHQKREHGVLSQTIHFWKYGTLHTNLKPIYNYWFNYFVTTLLLKVRRL
jgi:hypothetical protein